MAASHFRLSGVLVPILLLFILVPLVEIYFLIKVGSVIGVLPTILIVIFTAVLGTALLKQQGLATLRRYQESLARGQVPAQELIEGLALAFGGALLLTPGFVTDFVGFLCLLPVTRRPLIRWIMRHARFRFFSSVAGVGRSPGEAPGGEGRGRTIEGDYSVRSDRE